MTTISRMFSNYLKTAVSSISPYKVEEMSIEDFNKAYQQYTIAAEEANFALYVVANHFDAIFKPSTASSYCERKFYSIFRLPSKDEAIAKFMHCAEVVNRLDEAQSVMTRKKTGLEKIVEVCRNHATWNAAHIAAHLGLKECFMVPRILELVNQASETDGVFPIHVALDANNEETVRLMLSLSGLDVCRLDANGNSVLHFCVRKNNVNLLKLLLTRHANVVLNVLNDAGQSALHLTCKSPSTFECAKILLENGAAPTESQDAAGFPIHYAVRADSTELVKLLCSYNAEQINFPEESTGNCPLHYAANLDMIECLLTLGASVNNRNKEGRSFLHVTVEKGDLDSTLRILLTDDIDTNIVDENGNSALHLAIKKENLDMIRALIVFETNVNLVNNDGHTARHLLCRDGKNKYISGKERNLLLFTLSSVGAKRCPINQTECTDGCSNDGKFEGTISSPFLDYTANSMDSIEWAISHALKNQTKNNDSQKRGLRLLCLDGGGIRGLILTQVLLTVEKNLAGRDLRDCFDWVAGTSTGGFVALGITNKMTLRHLRRLYFLMKDQVFAGKRPYSSEPLEKLIKENFGETAKMMDVKHPKVVVTALLSDRFPPLLHLFRNYHPPVDELDVLLNKLSEEAMSITDGLYEADDTASESPFQRKRLASSVGSRCPVVISDSPDSNDQGKKFLSNSPSSTSVTHNKVMSRTGSKQLLSAWRDEKPSSLLQSAGTSILYGTGSSLDNPSLEPVDLPEDQPVWKAARASGAAPTFFRACGRFLDGGLASNNPTLDLMTEVQEYKMACALKNEPCEPIELVVSVGTGIIPTTPVAQIDIFRPNGPMEVFKSAMGLSSLGKILVEMATASEGRPVERSRAWCASLGIPFYRFSPPISSDISLDCSDGKVLLQMLWETQVYLFRNSERIAELCDLLQ